MNKVQLAACIIQYFNLLQLGRETDLCIDPDETHFQCNFPPTQAETRGRLSECIVYEHMTAVVLIRGEMSFR